MLLNSTYIISWTWTGIFVSNLNIELLTINCNRDMLVHKNKYLIPHKKIFVILQISNRTYSRYLAFIYIFFFNEKQHDSIDMKTTFI